MSIWRLITRATAQRLEGRAVELNFLAASFDEAVRVALEEQAKGEKVEALYELCPVVEGVGDWKILRANRGVVP